MTPLYRYLSSLIKMGIKSGVVPKIHRWGKAVNAGNMDRRDFFRTLSQIKEEIKAQADLISTGAEMETRKKAARLGLKTNKKLVNKIDETYKDSEVIANKIHNRKLREEARKLLKKGHRAVNEAHANAHRDMAGFDYWEGPRSPEDKRWVDTWLSRYRRKMKKKPMTQKEKALETIDMEEFMGAPVGSKMELEMEIGNTLLKRLGITKGNVDKIKELKWIAREGTSGFKDPLLDKWFKARSKLQKITGESTSQLNHYTLAGRDEMYAPPSGLNVKPVVKKVKELVGEAEELGENKIKSIWSGLADEFKKGYYGIEEIPLKKKK
jgi:hypothetical protein